MKNLKKALIAGTCSVLLVAGSVAGTMAYLTSTDTVTNTFTVGNVAITLDEAAVTTGGKYTTDMNNRVKTNKYHLMPGHEYIKDPVVHVDEKSENSWLFVTVDNGIQAIIEGVDNEVETIEEQMSKIGWSKVTETTNVYAYKDIVKAGDDVKVFEKFIIAGDADVTDTTANYATKSIVVNAYAVQADGFGTAAAAWNATFGAPTE